MSENQKSLLSEDHSISEYGVNLVEKWGDVLSAGKDIRGDYKKAAIAQLLENQATAFQTPAELNEDVPTNVTGGVAKWDPVLISMVRRSAPSLLAFDLAGVQPMTGPSGLVFAIRARYNNQAGDEALFYEANSAFSGAGTQSAGMFCGVKEATTTSGANTVTVVDTSDLRQGMLVVGQGIPENTSIATITNGTTFVMSANATASGTTNLAFAASWGEGMDTATGEGDINKQMAISIERIRTDAVTRSLKATYSHELAQDMRAIHRLDADQEIINVLTNELLAEQNREFTRRLYAQAKIGSVNATMPGNYDIVKDSDGRWSNERFKGLYFQVQREANRISIDTRMGRGNFIIASADVVTALAAAKVMSFSTLDINVDEDWTQSLYVGNLGSMRVYIDPYAPSDFFFVGYKGASPWDAGMFFCPYIPYQLLRGQDPASLQPIVAFKTRNAYVANPFFNGGTRTNGYYRISSVTNL
jgi:hypothetical protein